MYSIGLFSRLFTTTLPMMACSFCALWAPAAGWIRRSSPLSYTYPRFASPMDSDLRALVQDLCDSNPSPTRHSRTLHSCRFPPSGVGPSKMMRPIHASRHSHPIVRHTRFWSGVRSRALCSLCVPRSALHCGWWMTCILAFLKQASVSQERPCKDVCSYVP